MTVTRLLKPWLMCSLLYPRASVMFLPWRLFTRTKPKSRSMSPCGVLIQRLSTVIVETVQTPYGLCPAL
jgi:hypothetical protein